MRVAASSGPRCRELENSSHADLGAKIFGIGGDDADSVGGGPEQDFIDGRLVLERDRRDRRRHGENDVEVFVRQKLSLAIRQPLRAR